MHSPAHHSTCHSHGLGLSRYSPRLEVSESVTPGMFTHMHTASQAWREKGNGRRRAVSEMPTKTLAKLWQDSRRLRGLSCPQHRGFCALRWMLGSEAIVRLSGCWAKKVKTNLSSQLGSSSPVSPQSAGSEEFLRTAMTAKERERLKDQLLFP